MEISHVTSTSLAHSLSLIGTKEFYSKLHLSDIQILYFQVGFPAKSDFPAVNNLYDTFLKLTTKKRPSNEFRDPLWRQKTCLNKSMVYLSLVFHELFPSHNSSHGASSFCKPSCQFSSNCTRRQQQWSALQACTLLGVSPHFANYTVYSSPPTVRWSLPPDSLCTLLV